MSDERLPAFDEWVASNRDRAAPAAPAKPKTPASGVGAAFSGGGFKAAIFHLGALIRMNEIGALPRLDRISSVSGGTIAIVWLAKEWRKLQFDPATGIAANFDAVIRAPLWEFCRTKSIDRGSVASGVLLPNTSTAGVLARSYRKHLFGDATLQDLPGKGENHAPEFFFNATNLQFNSPWSFSKAEAFDYRVGCIRAPDFDLGTVTAASSAFPPVLAPLKLDLSGYTVSQKSFAGGPVPPVPPPPAYTRPVFLGDGGIYDNMGLERIFRDMRTVLVSNAGDPFSETPRPDERWDKQLRRTVSQIHRHAENNRLRWLIELAGRGERQVAAWRMSQRVGVFGAGVRPRLEDRDAWLAATSEVQLRALDQNAAARLGNHGYSLAAASLTAYWKKDAPPNAAAPASLPFV